MKKASLIISTAALSFLLACPADKKTDDKGSGAEPGSQATADDKKADEKPADADNAALRGVDLEKKVVKMGALNDESGPAAAIGKPFALGKRILAEQINAGGSGILPEGWKVEMVERDHGYNPGKSEQAFKEIKDDVLFVGTSFGTPNTLPLRPFLESEKVVAFPASLSSEMAANAFTPPLGPSYEIEAMRAMDWVVEQAKDVKKIKAAIVADQSDYGKDGVSGWKKAAAHHKVEVVSEQTIAPGQKDFTAVIAGLKKAGATHVLLTVLPSSTGPILGTAAKMKYMPQWIGNTPSWVDAFFAHPQLPAAVFTNFHWMNGLPYWGEKLPGMDKFLAAYDKFGKEKAKPDFYILVSYIQGLAALEAAKKAIDAGDASPDGYLKQVKGLTGFTAGGLIQPFDLSQVPYVTSTKTRVLKPDFEKKTWTVAADYADPKGAAAHATAAGDKKEAAPAGDDAKKAPEGDAKK
jgi:ABC-type branched-subunit amino acid transport system substrate-binding protein